MIKNPLDTLEAQAAHDTVIQPSRGTLQSLFAGADDPQ